MIFFDVLTQVAILFILMGVGFFLAKIKMIDPHTAQKVTQVIFAVVVPCIIISSFQIEVTPERMKGLGIAVISAVLAHLTGMGLAWVIYRKKNLPLDIAGVIKIGIIYSNCGFMGLPILEAVVGKEGILYGSVYIAVFNLFTWTQGVMLFQKEKNKLAGVKTALKNPAVGAIAVGVFLFAFSITLPRIIAQPVQSIAALNTPLSMMIVGSRIAATDLKRLFLDTRAYLPVFLRLAGIPLIMFTVLQLCGLSPLLLLSCLIPICCPASANTVLFGEMYGGNTELGSKILTISTLLSIITIPLFVTLAQII